MLVGTQGGAGTYTDKMDLMFAASGTAAGNAMGCEVTACSESQVTSYADFSTNYCNLRNLYCGSDDGCPYALRDLQSHEVHVHNGAGASHDASACVKSPTALCLVQLQATCGTAKVSGAAQCNTCSGTNQQALMGAHCTQAQIFAFCAAGTDGGGH